jgi:hypothetical protein
VRPHHVTLRDPSLPHQVVFLGGGDLPIQVSCNCRRTIHHTTPAYEPIGLGPTLDAARVLYDDPASHRTPFDPAVDAARW